MKILNLYAGIGGNRKLWGEEHEITAVEFDESIATIYQDRFPNDTMVVGDAKQYLLDHYKEFDFIWASPPCQTHSALYKCMVDCDETNVSSRKALFPDMSLWQLIVFLQHHHRGQWCVENVTVYYEPLIKPTIDIDRHLYWSNFNISKIEVKKDKIIERVTLDSLEDIDLSKYKTTTRKDQIIRNQVNYETGKHILDCAMGTVQHKQGGLF